MTMQAIATTPDIAPQAHLYQPFGVALDLWKCRAPEVVLSGPAGTGKSRACLEKVHFAAERYPGMRALILRKTRESLSESGLVTWEDKVLPMGHPALTPVQRRVRQVYSYPNGSEVVVGGLDKPQKVMSTEWDLVYIQEAIECTVDDWESVTTRLRNGVMPYQQLLADTNPWTPQHWLKQRAEAGLTLMLESRHEDNPVMYNQRRGRWTREGKRYLATLDRLTGTRKERLRHGKWVQAEGLVYETWDARVHLIDRMPDGWETWRRIRSVDFGYTNPFTCGWFAIDPDGRMYLYRQLYHTKRLVKDHTAQINELSQGERIEATVADHDAEDRATMAAEGVPTIAAYKSLSRGIEAFQSRLTVQEDGKPRFFVLRDSLVEADEELVATKKPYCFEHEIDGYVWPKGKDGKPVKEEPVKLNDHALDMARYAVAYVDGLASGQTRLMGGTAEPSEEAKRILEQATGWKNMQKRRQRYGG